MSHLFSFTCELNESLFNWILLLNQWVSCLLLMIYFCKNLARVVGTKNPYFESKIQIYGLIFCPHVEEIECDILFLVKFTLLFKIKRKGVFLYAKRYSRKKITYWNDPFGEKNYKTILVCFKLWSCMPATLGTLFSCSS